MITRDQRYAQAAFQKIKDAQREAWAEDYGRQCLHLPALIHQCGLCQTLTFLEAKAPKKPWFGRLRDDVIGVAGLESTAHIREIDVSEYQRLTRDALACAQWFKRYAEAILKVEAGGDEEGS
ncbi:MAG TPA: type III-B CRISPR module-associated protein Cmr5 [Bryobacteraceae bacterium]|jgi:CRISPR-associated protein Cmr5|nr:type III-B CRISPR module-associated protein Cmr5 [Bryobacteraceae bacterium]